MIVGGAKSASWVSVCAPTAWPDYFRSPIASWISAKTLGRVGDADAAAAPTSSRPGCPARRAPCRRARRPAPSRAGPALGVLAAGRAGSGRARASTALSTTSLTVPPSPDLIALNAVEVGVDPRVAAVRPDRHVVAATAGAGRTPAQAMAPTPREPGDQARRAAWRGARVRRAHAAGDLARARSRARPAPRRAAARATGAGGATTRVPGGAVGAGSGDVSKSTVAMSTPETPSTSAWWVLDMSAKRSPSQALDEPDLPQRLASGPARWAKTRPARRLSSCSPPGAGSAVWRMW